MNISVYGAASNNIDGSYIKAGEELGAALAKNGHTIVYGGGANGMMGAIARGAHSQNGKIIGVAPTFFMIDGVLFKECTELIYTKTVRERKQIMEEKADAFIAAPGGIGTFDEFFDILSLRQLQRHNKKIIIFNVNGYFNPLIAMFNSAISEHFISPQNLELFSVCETIDEIIEELKNKSTSDVVIEDLRSVMLDK